MLQKSLTIFCDASPLVTLGQSTRTQMAGSAGRATFTALTRLAVLLALCLVYAPQAQALVPWMIKKDSWSQADEKSFSKFVESIYESGCNTVDNCMKGNGNWYRDRDPRGLSWYADCGRFPYLLRSYFAFHNNLPFQSASSAVMRDPNDPNPVLQYTARGNVITSRRVVKSGVDGYRAIMLAVEAVYTALYRVDSRIDIASGQYGDFYHTLINREFIRPGSIVYDPNGHVATVAKISADGKVMLLDSHPDNTVSRVPYTGAFRATSPSQSGGFKNWRPVRLEGASVGQAGELFGGHLVVSANDATPGFSMEQFVGNLPNPKGNFGSAKWTTSDGVLGSGQFIDVIRARLSNGAVTYHPLEEVREEVDTLCSMFQDRAGAVQLAIENGIDKKAMPGGRLPMNIYGTSGEWELYSTPSRDARLKSAASEFRGLVEKIVGLHKSRSSKVVYSGGDLLRDMLAAHDEAAAKCTIQYRKSDGGFQSLSFDEAIQRLYLMSFDPYHCVELRWGATSAGELASCRHGGAREEGGDDDSDSGKKFEWYKAEQRLRNSLERKYDRQMGWSLEDLKQRADMDTKRPSNSVGSDYQVPLDARAFLMGSMGK